MFTDQIDRSDEETERPRFSVVKKLTFSDLWRIRNDAECVWLNKLTVNSLSPVLAYAGYLLGRTPNHLSFASAIFAVAAFVSSLVLQVDEPSISLVVLYLFVQLTYAFDCADGLLARVTDSSSELGEFLDKSIDSATGMLCFGAVFGYLFRYYSVLEQSETASLVLVLGFIYIVARSSRHFALNKFAHMFRNNEDQIGGNRSRSAQVFLSLMDSQASAMGVLLFLFSVWVGLGFFVCQTMILSAVYFRYFYRAYLCDKADR